MNYPDKREAIRLTMQSHSQSGLVGGDDIDKILMLTEQALGAGQEMSHIPGLNDAHEAWLEKLLFHRQLTRREYENRKQQQSKEQ